MVVLGTLAWMHIDRFTSEARALTSTMSNAVACVVVSIWENACDREVLARELQQNHVDSELALEQDGLLLQAHRPGLGMRATCILSLFTQGIDMALVKKKRVGKRTVSAKQVRKTASGRKRHKSDGTQPPKGVTPGSKAGAS